MNTLLEIEDLCVSFKTHGGVVEAVRGVSFSVGYGETVGIVGESGCGKNKVTGAELSNREKSTHVVHGRRQELKGDIGGNLAKAGIFFFL